MKKILVPCDFSDSSVEAFMFAVGLAKMSRGEIVVLKVIDMPIVYESSFGLQPFVFDPFLVKELEEDARKKFDVLLKEHSNGYQNIRFTVAQGDVTPMIRQAIDLQKADLVVMGTHGTSGIMEYLVGSNTEKIVRYSPVPVFAIRKSMPVEKIKNIVFATTLDLNQTTLVKKVKELQNFFNAMLHVLVVNTPDNFRRDSDLQEALENYAKHYSLDNYILNKRSDPKEMDGILRFAKEVKADIIAMATHGHWGLFHLLVGSIAEDVANHGTCPVWTFSLRGK